MTREEAIEKIRQMSLPKETMEILEALAPELKESEDERIINQLITLVDSTGEVLLIPTNKEELIAWLEKQKDASYAIEAVERIDKYIDEHLANAHDMKDSNPDKKYYRGWDDALGKMAGILQDVYSGEKQKEQKPAEWSEDIIRKAVKEVGLTQHQIDWFKTNVFSPKQEWSEEDEKWINYFYSLLGLACEKDIHGLGQKAIDAKMWLKSLRPVSKESLQSHWKPSEEQMDALEE